jgi:hypothetical protein
MQQLMRFLVFHGIWMISDLKTGQSPYQNRSVMPCKYIFTKLIYK